jgi:hypothetical protein
LAFVAALAFPAFAQPPPTPGRAATAPSATTPSATWRRTLADTLTGRAQEAYEAARLLLVNDDFAGALHKFEQAFELSKDPRLLYDMAICNKSLHAYARMQALLVQYEHDAGDDLTPSERAAVDTALAATSNLVGRLNLTVNPAGATVLLDGEIVGVSPIQGAILVDLGKHVLSARKTDFRPEEKPIDVPGGDVANVTIALTPAPRAAELLVVADESAVILLDGKVVGSGRYQSKVPAGAHTLRVVKKGKRAFQSTIELRDGEPRTLDITLADEKHAPAWPWLVAGAAVVAGGVVGGYFLFKPSDTTTPIPPGKLAGVTLANSGGVRW